MIRKHCAISADGERLLENVVSRLGFSARAHQRSLELSRTIGDLDGVESIDPKHLSEAIHYRTLDRSHWALSRLEPPVWKQRYIGVEALSPLTPGCAVCYPYIV
jgi:hypothetical protein